MSTDATEVLRPTFVSSSGLKGHNRTPSTNKSGIVSITSLAEVSSSKSSGKPAGLVLLRTRDNVPTKTNVNAEGSNLGGSSISQTRGKRFFSTTHKTKKTVMVASEVGEEMDLTTMERRVLECIEQLFEGKDIKALVQVKTLSQTTLMPEPIEYLVLVGKPYEKRDKIILVRGSLDSLTVAKKWRLDELLEYDADSETTLHDAPARYGGSSGAHRPRKGSLSGSSRASGDERSDSSVGRGPEEGNRRLTPEEERRRELEEQEEYMRVYPILLRFSEKELVFGAFSSELRTRFLRTLYKVCHAHMEVQPATQLDFDLFDDGEEEEDAEYCGEYGSAGPGGERYFTAAEEQELLQYLGDDVAADFDVVYSRLTERLTKLESEYISGLLRAQKQVDDEIKPSTADAMAEARGMEGWLDSFDTQLRAVRRCIEHIEERNNQMEVVTKNQRELRAVINDVILRLSLDQYRGVLDHPKFDDMNQLPMLIECANKVRSILGAELDPHFLKLKAVADLKGEAKKMAGEFDNQLSGFLIRFIDGLGKEAKKVVGGHSMKLSGDAADNPYLYVAELHSKLDTYAPLVSWLADMSAESQKTVCDVYMKTFETIYKNCTRGFIQTRWASVAKGNRARFDQFRNLLFDESGKKLSPEWFASVTHPNYIDPREKTIDIVCIEALAGVLKAVNDEIVWATKVFGLKEDFFESQTMPDKFILLGGTYREDIKNMLSVAFKDDPFSMLEILVVLESFSGNKGLPYIVQGEASFFEQQCRMHFGTFLDAAANALAATKPPLSHIGIMPNFTRFPFFVRHMDEYRKTSEKLLECAQFPSPRSLGILGVSALPSAMDVAAGASAEGGTMAVADGSSTNTLLDMGVAKLLTALFHVLTSISEDESATSVYMVRIINITAVQKELADTQIAKRLPALASGLERIATALTKSVNAFALHLLKKHFNRLLMFFVRVKEMTLTMPAEEVKYSTAFSKQEAMRVTRDYKASFFEKTFTVIIRSIAKRLPSSDLETLTELWNHFMSTMNEKYLSMSKLMQSCYAEDLPVSPGELVEISQKAWDTFLKRRKQKQKKNAADGDKNTSESSNLDTEADFDDTEDFDDDVSVMAPI